MAKPTVRVRIAFSDGPYVVSPTWTDVTSYVRSINTSRGRTDDWQNFDSGSATLVLDNRDRRFDPMYTTGPYYGNLQPRRQIRIDATTDSVTYYDIFRGFIDGWPVNLTVAGYDSTVTVTCYDLLGLVAQAKLPVDWSANYIKNLSPGGFWKLDDTIDPANIPQTAATVANLQLKDYAPAGRNLQASAEKTPTANAESMAPGIGSKTVNWAGVYSTTKYGLTESLQQGSNTTGSLWFNLGNAQYVKSLWEDWNYDPSYSTSIGHYWEFDITNRRLNLNMGPRSVSPGTATWRVYYFPVALNLAIPHHMAFSIANTGLNTATIALYVDGQTIASSGNATFTGPPGLGENAYTYNFSGGQQQIAVFSNQLLTGTQMQTIYKLGNNVLTETTSARLQRIWDELPPDASWLSKPASPAGTVAELTVGGAFAGNELQLTADSEGGELYTTKAGILTMTNRTWFETGNSLTNQATFGVGGIPIGTEITYAWNADNIRNTLDIGWSGGANYTATDTASVNLYGTCQDSYQTNLSTLADVQNLATYLIEYGRLPRLVMSAIEVGQAMSSSQWVTVLGLELLERITVVVDEQVGSDLSQTQLIQQIEHEITPGDWKVRILGSSRWSSYFILDTSKLDSTDLLG